MVNVNTNKKMSGNMEKRIERELNLKLEKECVKEIMNKVGGKCDCNDCKINGN